MLTSFFSLLLLFWFFPFFFIPLSTLQALKKDMGPHGKVVIDGSNRQEVELPAEELPVGPDMSTAELEEQEERLSRGK